MTESNATSDLPNTPVPQRAAVLPAMPACIPSGQLFAGAQEVQIDHYGMRYRLKQTALGKLILTK